MRVFFVFARQLSIYIESSIFEAHSLKAPLLVIYFSIRSLSINLKVDLFTTIARCQFHIAILVEIFCRNCLTLAQEC